VESIRAGSFPLSPGNGAPTGFAQSHDLCAAPLSVRQTGLERASRRHGFGPTCGLSIDESFDEDDLYEAMDLLNGHWAPLEKNLYQEAFPQGVRMVLYDLTSSYFEGKGPEHLSRYGHSRDHRCDRRQVILAVATDPRESRCIWKFCEATALTTKPFRACWPRCAGALASARRPLCLMAG